MKEPIDMEFHWNCPICFCSHKYYEQAKYCCQRDKRDE